jgi:hypothetical protein
LSGDQALGLAQAADGQGRDALLAPNALATARPEEMCAMPTAAIPASQEDGVNFRAMGVRLVVWMAWYRIASDAPPPHPPRFFC